MVLPGAHWIGHGPSGFASEAPNRSGFGGGTAGWFIARAWLGCFQWTAKSGLARNNKPREVEQFENLKGIRGLTRTAPALGTPCYFFSIFSYSHSGDTALGHTPDVLFRQKPTHRCPKWETHEENQRNTRTFTMGNIPPTNSTEPDGHSQERPDDTPWITPNHKT
jgi:hypothetical protein